ncbi:MAG: hypothetical protein ACFFFG_08375 [Candidatus Thorarchaeota archaeon]
MRNLRFVKLMLIALFLITVSPVSSILLDVNQTPIIFIDELTDDFTPTMYEGWDYYILPPGSSFQDVYYYGTTTDLTAYTTTSPTANVFGTTSGLTLTRGSPVSSTLLQNTSRNGNHDFFDPVPYPRVVRIDNGTLPTFNQTIKRPLSLHIDYASTFFAEGFVEYWGYVQINDTIPFLMDVTFSATDVVGLLLFDDAYPESGHIVGSPENKMTFPIFPKQAGVQNFTLMTAGSTLVTLTPHSWDFPPYPIPELNTSTLFAGELNQGSPWLYNESTDQLLKQDNPVYSIRMFNLSIVQDEFYRINAIFDMEEVKPGVSSPEPLRFLVGEQYEYISGNIDQDGMIIRARESGHILLVLYSPGEANGQYSIFYQKELPSQPFNTVPLEFDTPLSPEYNVFYTFSFSSPVMMGVNRTVSSGTNNRYDFEFYEPGIYPGEWISVSDDAFLTIFEGNLFGDALGDIAGNWQYIPAGSYAIEFTNIFDFADEIQFTAVPVQQPSTLQVNQDSIFAIELPLVKNRLNWVNLSTTDQVYPVQQVRYEWTFVGKYNEQISAGTNWDWFGNENETTNPGVWEAWDYNDTIINAYLPTRDYEVPILMIRPFEAWNATPAQLETFSASLTVSTIVAAQQSAYDLSALGGVSPFLTNIPQNYMYSDSVSGQQYFIPLSSISSSTTFLVNDDYTTDDDHLYGIPLALDPYSIYNITVYLIGNFSTYNPGNPNFNEPDEFLNVSFQEEGWSDYEEIYVHGGNLQSLEIFGSATTYNGGFDNTSQWRSVLILTVSSMSYLFVDLEREPGSGPALNGTMQIVIQKLSIADIGFQLDSQYNPTVSEQEVFTENPVVSDLIPPELYSIPSTPPFPLEALLLVGGVVGVGAVAAAGVYFVRKRRQGY